MPFGVDKSMLDLLAPLRQGEAINGRVAIAPESEVQVRYFSRYRNGLIRDGMVLSRG